MDPSAQYAVIASREAMEDAGSPEVDPQRLGVAIGTGIGGVWTLLDQWDNLKEKGPRRVFPLAVPMLMPNTSAGNVSLELGARAGAHTTVSACASGAEAMGTGLRDDPHRPRRRRRGRRHRGRHPPAAVRRVRADAGALDPQRRPRARLAPLRHRPRRLRHGRGRGRHRARGVRARQGPRRHDLRRARRRRACPPTPTTSPPPSPRAPAPPAPCSRPSSAAGLSRQGHRPHQRPRHLDPGRRHRRVQRHPAGLRRRRRRHVRSAPPSR